MLGMEHFLIPLRPMNTETYFQPSVAQVNGAAGTLGVPQRAETSLRQSGFGLRCSAHVSFALPLDRGRG
jgi:hypothetical protein